MRGLEESIYFCCVKLTQVYIMAENQYCYKYPHPAVTTDCIIFGFDGKSLQVLLIERGTEPFKGRWALPSGFLNPDESAEEGAIRELTEETGHDGGYTNWTLVQFKMNIINF